LLRQKFFAGRPTVTTYSEKLFAESLDFWPVLPETAGKLVHPLQYRRDTRDLNLAGRDAQLMVHFFPFFIIGRLQEIPGEFSIC
jgi:hypothetical protein